LHCRKAISSRSKQDRSHGRPTDISDDDFAAARDALAVQKEFVGVMVRGRWISTKKLNQILEAIAVLLRAKVTG
jgi:hypothetical protein